MQPASSPEVFAYRDYRTYLRDVYSFRKESEYGFSYRAFARQAGLSSPNYLKLVTDGQRNLTAEMAGRFARALGLRGEPASYFCDLVAFNQAGAAPERERCYARLTRYRRYRNSFRLDDAHAAYHSEWYVPAIRELAACQGFREDPRWIARTLQPAISTKQAEQALAVLERLGLLVRDASGKLVHNEPTLTTGEDRPLGHHVTTFHRAMLERAAEALDSVPRQEREIASLTLGLSPERARTFKARLQALRRELLDASLDDADGDPTRVVQINFQMFPLSRESQGNNP
jgi:uncharacterized protein (TIGR02147 family)